MAITYPACCSQGAWKKPPIDIVLHGTRGGNPNRTAEYRGTCQWVGSPNNGGVSWHVTIGDGVYEPHLPMGEWGWHAGITSTTHIGVEFVQPTVNDAITDAQVAAFGDWYRTIVLPAWPHITAATARLPSHSEVPQGISDGKSDLWPRGDERINHLRARLRVAMGVLTDDQKLELVYQQDPEAYGDKLYSGHLDRPYYRGMVLRTTYALLTPDGQNLIVTRPGSVLDDVEQAWEAAGVLIRY